jgi:hypothetical protein
MMQVMAVNGRVGAFSWTTGFKPATRAIPRTYDQEASKDSRHAAAVINRLMRLGQWTEAERIMDTYMK